MYLLLGPPGTGKTLLIEKLEKESITFSKCPARREQTGNRQKKTQAGQKDEAFQAPTITDMEKNSFSFWSQFLTPQCIAILYMIDSANRRQISQAFILLLKVLSWPATNHVPVLVLLNKCDKVGSMKRNEVEAYLHLKDVVRCSSIPISSTPTDDNIELGYAMTSKQLALGCDGGSADVNRRVNVLECSSLEGTGLPNILSWLQQNNIKKR